MSDPLRHVLYAPCIGEPTVEVLEVTGYSAKEGAYLAGERRLKAHELVRLTPAQAQTLQALEGAVQREAARQLRRERRAPYTAAKSLWSWPEVSSYFHDWD